MKRKKKDKEKEKAAKIIPLQAEPQSAELDQQTGQPTNENNSNSIAPLQHLLIEDLRTMDKLLRQHLEEE